MSQIGNEVRLSKIVESDFDGTNFKYYLNFIELNRRMDQWMSSDIIKQILNPDSDIVKNTIPYDHRQVAPEPGELDEESLFMNDENKGMDTRQVEEHEQATKIKTINYLQINQMFKIKCWYFSPFPSEYQNIETLYICQNCMSLHMEE